MVPIQKSKAPFILGIVSIVVGLLIPVIGVICGIIGLVLANNGNKNLQEQEQLQASIETSFPTPEKPLNYKTETILNVIGIVFSVINWIAGIILLSS